MQSKPSIFAELGGREIPDRSAISTELGLHSATLVLQRQRIRRHPVSKAPDGPNGAKHWWSNADCALLWVVE